MVALVDAKYLDFGDALPAAAREAIQQVLAADPRATRQVYAALARKVWSLLIEHRFDPELREWHDLLHRVRTRVRAADSAAAERMTALADLLRESISLAKTSPARAMATRPKARRILERLNDAATFVARQTLLEELEMGGSHLSNVLTQLVANNLVTRRDKGKEAEFRITEFGRQVLRGDSIIERDRHALLEDLRAALVSTDMSRLAAAATGGQNWVSEDWDLWGCSLSPSWTEGTVGLPFHPGFQAKIRPDLGDYLQMNLTHGAEGRRLVSASR